MPKRTRTDRRESKPLFVAKKANLSNYLELIKSFLDKKEITKAKRLAEKALKKLPDLSYTPYEEYLLHCRLGYIYQWRLELSHSLDSFHEAYLISSKNHLSLPHIIYTSYMLGYDFLLLRNTNMALKKFEKVEEYYAKHGTKSFPMDENTYLKTLIDLGYCYLLKNELDKVEEIIEKKLSKYSISQSDKKFQINYKHLKGEYLMALKNYPGARKLFQECIKEDSNSEYPSSTLEVKKHLATIDFIEGKLDDAIQCSQGILKEAKQLGFNDVVCEAGLFLSKCYFSKGLPDKSEAIENRIKPLLATLDTSWLYEMMRDFVSLFRQSTSSKTAPDILVYAINNRYKTSPCKEIVIGNSIVMHEVYQLIEKIAPTDMPVLIHGETGTGKELIAHIIHTDSLRGKHSCLAFNCGAIPETLIESGLFGHTKGAFTGAIEDTKGYIELASGGTLFIDEISNMSSSMQQKLLRVLEEKLLWRIGASKSIPVNTRFVFASNQNIEQMVKQKLFREDLFYRINTIVINLPPLRDRKEDILLLAQHFLQKCLPTNKKLPEIPADTSELLINYPWPGNVRELENEMKKICVLFPDTKTITPSMLSETIQNYKEPYHKDNENANHSLKVMTDNFQRDIIIGIMRKFDANISKTAHYLGYERRYLYKKMKQLKIEIPIKSND
ncbi:MAG: sigma 54-interacting transcriptional regulator [Planctomycetes bacterium]|nr:sigma 54-interacting transcriptional regulator [Planctomycetota bacterium]